MTGSKGSKREVEASLFPLVFSQHWGAGGWTQSPHEDRPVPCRAEEGHTDHISVITPELKEFLLCTLEIPAHILIPGPIWCLSRRC